MLLKKNLRWILIVSACVSIAAAILLYSTIRVPFGILFNASMYSMIAGIISVCIILAVMCIRSFNRRIRFCAVLPGIFAALILTATVAGTVDIRMLYFMGAPPAPSKQEWIADLHFLADTMRSTYPDIYSRVSEEKLSGTVREIETKIPGLTDPDIVMELFRLTALPVDAHTIPFVFIPCFDLHDFPIKIFRFEEGWFIIDAAPAYRNLIGMKILKVGKADIEELYKKFIPYLAAENEYSRLERFTYIGLVTEWLCSQNIINDRHSAQFVLEQQDGQQTTVTMDAVQFPYKFYWAFSAPIANRASSVFTNPRDDFYWFDYNEKAATIYFQFNAVENQKGRETIAEFTRRLAGFVNGHPFDTFIIDLRNNMGGDDRYLRPLLKLIRDDARINRRNTLYVLTGRRTFSSAVLFAQTLRYQTRALFVGEPAAQGPVFGGNPAFVTLPHSKLIFAIATTSTARTQLPPPFHFPAMLQPDIMVPVSHRDFAEGRDAVLEAALHHSSSKDSSTDLKENMLDCYTGRFVADPCHILEMSRKGNELTVTIDDFTPDNLFRVQSALTARSDNEFTTDIADVTISFPQKNIEKASTLFLSWKGTKILLERAPAGYSTPLESMKLGSIVEAVKQFEKDKAAYAKLSFMENLLNGAGYKLLNEKKMADAISVFRLNTELFPDSWNTFDSLGEAYFAAGNIVEAKANYEKSLRLNPASKSGIDALKKLKAG